jgi:hypothetical protein
MKNSQFAMNKIACRGVSNDGTVRAYKSSIDRFQKWADKSGLKIDTRASEGVLRGAVQRYADSMTGKSASTVHTYLAPVCKGLGVKMSDIQKPVRHAGDYSKARSGGERNSQGINERFSPENARIVNFEGAVGIRRAELADLRGRDLIEKDGRMFVRVAQGKGGKTQLQEIIKPDQQVVKDTFQGVKPDQRVFKPEDFKNKISFHTLRAEHARSCYKFYEQQLRQNPELREVYNKQLESYYRQMNDMNRPGAARSYENFKKDCLSGGEYRMRGGIADKAAELGRAVVYDRTALSMVSVFELAHWRNDVTITDYMI